MIDREILKLHQTDNVYHGQFRVAFLVGIMYEEGGGGAAIFSQPM